MSPGSPAVVALGFVLALLPSPARAGPEPHTSAKVVPDQRSVVAATPPSASSALYVNVIATQLPKTLDAFERLFGVDAAEGFAEGASLPHLALRQLAGSLEGVDTRRGLGLFHLPGFKGAVGLVAVAHEEKALRSAVQYFRRQGATAAAAQDGTWRVHTQDDGTYALFVERGYLYVALPDTEEVDQDGELTPIPPDDPARAIELVRKAPSEGLEATARFGRLRREVSPGDLTLFVNPGRADPAAQGMLLTFQDQGGHIRIDGYLSGDVPLVEPSAGPSLFASAPAHPLLAVAFRAGTEQFVSVFAGHCDSERRRTSAAKAHLYALPLEAWSAALGGNLEVLAYRQPDKGPEVTVLFRTQVRDDKALRAVVEQQLDGVGAVVHRRDANGKTTWTGTAFDREVEITLSAQVLDGRLGPALTDPVRGDLRPALRARSEPEAWGAGHLTVGLDLGSFQQQLLKGAPPGLRELAEGFLTESLALGGGYLDLAPVTGGARLRGRIDVLPRKVR